MTLSCLYPFLMTVVLPRPAKWKRSTDREVRSESQCGRNCPLYTLEFLWIKGCACEWTVLVFTFPPQYIISIGPLSAQGCPLLLCLNHKFSAKIRCLMFSSPSPLHQPPSLISSPYPKMMKALKTTLHTLFLLFQTNSFSLSDCAFYLVELISIGFPEIYTFLYTF